MSMEYVINFKMAGKTVEGSDCWEIECKDGWMYGCIHEGVIMIWTVSSESHSLFKRMMNCLVDQLKIKKILFTNVINDNLQRVLKGFRMKEVYWEVMDTNIFCLEGEWERECPLKDNQEGGIYG